MIPGTCSPVVRDFFRDFATRSIAWRGHRFFGSTKVTTKREAEPVERAEREKAKRHVEQASAAATSLRLDGVAGRYWQEVGLHHAGDAICSVLDDHRKSYCQNGERGSQ
jgi:hypothetical protein